MHARSEKEKEKEKERERERERVRQLRYIFSLTNKYFNTNIFFKILGAAKPNKYFNCQS